MALGSKRDSYDDLYEKLVKTDQCTRLQTITYESSKELMDLEIQEEELTMFLLRFNRDYMLNRRNALGCLLRQICTLKEDLTVETKKSFGGFSDPSKSTIDQVTNYKATLLSLDECEKQRLCNLKQALNITRTMDKYAVRYNLALLNAQGPPTFSSKISRVFQSIFGEWISEPSKVTLLTRYQMDGQDILARFWKYDLNKNGILDPPELDKMNEVAQGVYKLFDFASGIRTPGLLMSALAGGAHSPDGQPTARLHPLGGNPTWGRHEESSWRLWRFKQDSDDKTEIHEIHKDMAVDPYSGSNPAGPPSQTVTNWDSAKALAFREASLKDEALGKLAHVGADMNGGALSGGDQSLNFAEAFNKLGLSEAHTGALLRYYGTVDSGKLAAAAGSNPDGLNISDRPAESLHRKNMSARYSKGGGSRFRSTTGCGSKDRQGMSTMLRRLTGREESITKQLEMSPDKFVQKLEEDQIHFNLEPLRAALMSTGVECWTDPQTPSLWRSLLTDPSTADTIFESHQETQKAIRMLGLSGGELHQMLCRAGLDDKGAAGDVKALVGALGSEGACTVDPSILADYLQSAEAARQLLTCAQKPSTSAEDAEKCTGAGSEASNNVGSLLKNNGRLSTKTLKDAVGNYRYRSLGNLNGNGNNGNGNGLSTKVKAGDLPSIKNMLYVLKMQVQDIVPTKLLICDQKEDLFKTSEACKATVEMPPFKPMMQYWDGDLFEWMGDAGKKSNGYGSELSGGTAKEETEGVFPQDSDDVMVKALEKKIKLWTEYCYAQRNVYKDDFRRLFPRPTVELYAKPVAGQMFGTNATYTAVFQDKITALARLERYAHFMFQSPYVQKFKGPGTLTKMARSFDKMMLPEIMYMLTQDEASAKAFLDMRKKKEAAKGSSGSSSSFLEVEVEVEAQAAPKEVVVDPQCNILFLLQTEVFGQTNSSTFGSLNALAKVFQKIYQQDDTINPKPGIGSPGAAGLPGADGVYTGRPGPPLTTLDDEFLVRSRVITNASYMLSWKKFGPMEAMWDQFKCSLRIAYSDPLTSNVDVADRFDMCHCHDLSLDKQHHHKGAGDSALKKTKIHTDGNQEWSMLSRQVSDTTVFVKVKGSSNAYLGLASSKTPESPLYEIQISGWNNSLTGVSRIEGKDRSKPTPDHEARFPNFRTVLDWTNDGVKAAPNYKGLRMMFKGQEGNMAVFGGYRAETGEMVAHKFKIDRNLYDLLPEDMSWEGEGYVPVDLGPGFRLLFNGKDSAMALTDTRSVWGVNGATHAYWQVGLGKAGNEAGYALNQQPNGEGDQKDKKGDRYFIMIGPESGYSETTNVLDASKEKEFWVSFGNGDGVIEIGEGAILGRKTLVKWKDSKPLDVNWLGVRTTHNQVADWVVSYA